MMVELGVHSYFSFLDGASSPADLAEQAARLGYDALGLTDGGGLYGAVQHSRAARAAGLRPLFGADLHLEGGGSFGVLVRDEQGWFSLCRLLSRMGLQRDASGRPVKGKGRIRPQWLAEENATTGLVALTGGPRGWVPGLLGRGDRPGAVEATRQVASQEPVRHRA